MTIVSERSYTHQEPLPLGPGPASDSAIESGYDHAECSSAAGTLEGSWS